LHQQSSLLQRIGFHEYLILHILPSNLALELGTLRFSDQSKNFAIQEQRSIITVQEGTNQLLNERALLLQRNGVCEVIYRQELQRDVAPLKGELQRLESAYQDLGARS